MTSTSSIAERLDFLFLPRTRRLVRGSGGRTLALAIAVLYGLLSLYAGGMLVFGPTGDTTTTVQVVSIPYDPQWWIFPALVVIGPSGLLTLPFFATVTMVLVSIGVGLGMGAGLLVARQVWRQWKTAKRGTGASSALAGMTPAMVALLTLGACCSTSAAAAAGIGAVAVSSGVSMDLLRFDNWYLNLFQLAVLFVALVAQEQLLALYGGLLGVAPGTERARDGTARPTLHRVRAPVVAIRVFLAAAGTLWALAFLLELAAPPPGVPFAGVLLGGLLQHVFLGVFLILASLAPALLLGLSRETSLMGATPVFRVLLLLCGLSVLVGVPPPVNGWGMGGLGNDVLRAAGVSTAAGASVVGPSLGGPAADLTWAAVYALLGLFGVLIAWRPHRWLTWLLGDVAGPREAPTPSADEPEKVTPDGRGDPSSHPTPSPSRRSGTSPSVPSDATPSGEP